LWAGLALLELEGANHALAGQGAAFAVAAAVAQLAIGLAVLRPRWRRAALGAGIALAVTYGLFGQDLGGLLTGRATDPGTAPLLVLLALALWPRRHLTPSNISPAG
jgi:hypothetical protein